MGEPRVHVVLLKVPVPATLKVRVPVGADLVPLVSVSVTVAVQELGAFSATDAGEQLTVVVVARVFTPRPNVPELEA